MAPWDDGWVPTPELLVYWAEGNGVPNPFAYHPGMETMFDARRDELLRQETIYVAQGKKKLQEILNSRTPPSPPEPMSMPGLYYLRQFHGEVTLPWSWDHSSGEIFRRKWENSFCTQEFQESLQRCLWWWTAKKVSIYASGHFLNMSLDL